MKKLILAALTLLVLSPTVYSAPGGFNQSLNLFEEGTSPNLDKINSKNLEGGCYTEFSPVEFLQEFVVSFKKGDSSQYNLEFFDPKKNETTYFNNLIISKEDVQTQKQWLSQDAFFKMSYKENGKYLIEKITLHDVKASAEMILNMCYYNL
jgi:hypothetical protein